MHRVSQRMRWITRFISPKHSRLYLSHARGCKVTQLHSLQPKNTPYSFWWYVSSYKCTLIHVCTCDLMNEYTCAPVIWWMNRRWYQSIVSHSQTVSYKFKVSSLCVCVYVCVCVCVLHRLRFMRCLGLYAPESGKKNRALCQDQYQWCSSVQHTAYLCSLSCTSNRTDGKVQIILALSRFKFSLRRPFLWAHCIDV